SYETQFKLTFGENAFTGDFHQALLYRGFLLSILLFGVGYYLVSRDTSRNRGIVWLGAAGKILVFAFFTHAFLQGHATAAAWAVSIGDFLWTWLFFLFLYQTKDRVRVSNLIG
ncbi:MAG: hypothetical protein ACYS0F_15810, partial [Planctomycetota bacterium]